MTSAQPIKILIMRLLNVADVAAIAVPAIRYYQAQYPNAEITFLSFGQGKEIVELAEPTVKHINLARQDWPDAFIPAMESFLGLAEKIVGEAYDQIINLDTSFMPCFLARFLKDAGERVMGNYMSLSVQELIDQFQAQQLKPEYVNDPMAFMLSTFPKMDSLYGAWWQTADLPQEGFPQHFLQTCCGFTTLKFDMKIAIEPDAELLAQAAGKYKVALATNAVPNYPHLNELKQQLQDKGVFVWSEPFTDMPMQQKLAKLAACDLVITPPSEFLWLAKAAGTQTLLISGATEPQILMPDFATDPTGECPACLQQIAANDAADNQLLCNCVKPKTVIECVDEIVAAKV
ncbi:hypothetical protein DS2_12343 [Catenovulum agarivorans DS-2]|uniref:Uncharacterized protein n=1 Tax=Catenovulum agarivorans DS-2 TaxID=1328313 RepID=W7QBU0_9ALTE|nr:hypothetical protein [Catenovulum agarivorans]EWH09471.1 hypothetical protein DS2_12343 [Catenovulum agarivorans DS-2]